MAYNLSYIMMNKQNKINNGLSNNKMSLYK